MNINKVCCIDLMVMIAGILLIIVVKNAARFIGVGVLSMAFTYFLVDGNNLVRRLK